MQLCRQPAARPFPFSAFGGDDERVVERLLLKADDFWGAEAGRSCSSKISSTAAIVREELKGWIQPPLPSPIGASWPGLRAAILLLELPTSSLTPVGHYRVSKRVSH